MEVAVAIPLPPPTDFNFHSNCSSPYITAPSSPQPLGNIPLKNNNDAIEEFEFDFTGQLQRPSLSADELFHGGKILPLNLTTTTTTTNNNNNQSSTEKNIGQVAIDDQRDSHKLVVSHHPAASTNSRWCSSHNQSDPWRLVTGLSNKSNGYSSNPRDKQQKRGRQRDSSLSYNNKSNKDKGVSSFISETATISSATSTYCDSFLSSIWFTKGYRKWKLKNFLLFRSASEGRGRDKDPLRKYSVLSKTAAYEDVGNCSSRSKTTACDDVGSCSFRSKRTTAYEDVGSCSFRSKRTTAYDDVGSCSFRSKRTTAYEDVGSCSFRSTEESCGSVSRRRVSAHELHYTVNRAASEELKKKTLLPYKHGLLGCMRFNTTASAGMHFVSTGIGSLERS